MLCRRSAIAQLGAAVRSFKVAGHQSTKGLLQLGARINNRILFYIYCYICLYFIIFLHKLHFCDYIFYNDFIRFYLIS